MTPRRTSKTVVNEVKESHCKGIKTGTAVLTLTGSIKIPDYVLATYECCNDVISISYDIKVRPKVKDDMEKLLPIFLPVIVGHPPKQEVPFTPIMPVQGYPHPSSSTSNVQAVPVYGVNPTALPSYDDLMRSDAGAGKM